MITVPIPYTIHLSVRLNVNLNQTNKYYKLYNLVTINNSNLSPIFKKEILNSTVSDTKINFGYK